MHQQIVQSLLLDQSHVWIVFYIEDLNFPFHIKKTFMASFYERGSTVSMLEPLRGGSLLFMTKFPDIPGTHFIDLRRMKGRVNLDATQWF